MVDIVKKDEKVKYYEQWLQLGSKYYEDFHLFSYNYSEYPQENLLFLSNGIYYADNQEEPIELEQLTYNGYCILTNVKSVAKVEGAISYPNAYYLNSREFDSRYSHKFQYDNKTADTIVIPISAIYFNAMRITIKTRSGQRTDSVTNNLWNSNHLPFVATFNMTNLTETTYTTY